MKIQKLKFLYTRIKSPNLTKEQAESKVCQEILISLIGNNKEISKRVAFKGGVIIDNLAKGDTPRILILILLNILYQMKELANSLIN